MAKWDHGEELKMDQQNFPQTPIVPASFGLQAEVILRLLVLKLDAHLEAAAEKSCSVFLKLTNYPDRVSVRACARTLPHTSPKTNL